MPLRPATTTAAQCGRPARVPPRLRGVARPPPGSERRRWSSAKTSYERHAFLREYSPGPGRRLGPHKGYNILGVVDVESDPRQMQHIRPDATCFGRLKMWVETVLAKAQGHSVGWRAGDRVRAALVVRRDDRERGGCRMRGEQPLDFARSYQRDITGQGQHALVSLGGEQPNRRGYRAGVAIARAHFD